MDHRGENATELTEQKPNKMYKLKQNNAKVSYVSYSLIWNDFQNFCQLVSFPKVILLLNAGRRLFHSMHMCTTKFDRHVSGEMLVYYNTKSYPNVAFSTEN